MATTYGYKDPLSAWAGRTPGQGEKELDRAAAAGGMTSYFRDADDRARIKGYMRNESLMDVDTHYQRFAELGPDVSPPSKSSWIPVDFFGMLARLMRHYVFGLDFKVAGKRGAANTDAVARIFTANDFHEMMAQAAESSTACGDAVFRVDVEDLEDEEDPEVVRPVATIRAVHPCHYFPEVDPLDHRRVKAVTLAFTFPVDDAFRTQHSISESHVVLLERNEPALERGGSGTVSYKLFSWDGSAAKAELNVSAMFPELEDGETGIDEIPIVHVGVNVPAAEFWGRSEFQRVERIVLALENRLSQEDEVLEKHARPKLIVGPGILNPDARSNLADFDVIEIEPSILEKAIKPEYLTWDFQVQAIEHEIEKLEEYLFMTTETSPASFGLERDGSQVESARALRFKAHRTVNKVNDRRTAFARGIRNLFRIAQKMELAALTADGAETYKRGPVVITWPDPIIEDSDAEVQNYVSRKGAGLVSRVRAVADLDDLTEEEAQDEVQEILQDQVDEAAAQVQAAPRTPAPFGAGGAPDLGGPPAAPGAPPEGAPPEGGAPPGEPAGGTAAVV